MYLPEILVTVSGESISTVEDWETFRKPEILGLFSQNVYGVRPMERPEDLSRIHSWRAAWLLTA